MEAVAHGELRNRLLRGCAIMVLVGLAMQIKYAAAFEGIFFGLSLLWIGWLRNGAKFALVARAMAWIGCAVAPTAAAYLAYLSMGHGSEFVQANFVSVLQDERSPLAGLPNLAGLMLGLAPFLICFVIAWRYWRSPEDTGDRQLRWILAWAGSSMGGFLAFGAWADHYALPLLVPLSISAALAFDCLKRRFLAMFLVVGLGLAGGLARASIEIADNGTAIEVSELSERVSQNLGHGCLYVEEGLPILYMKTHSCLPTRFVFPEHLNERMYRNSLGVNQAAEYRRLLASRPAAIVVHALPESTPLEFPRNLLAEALKRDYAKVSTAKVGSTFYAIYRLNNR